jgi:hypothetical protein
MAITFKCKIALCSGTMFLFGTISCIADEEGTLHPVVDPPEKKLSTEIPREAEAKQRVVPPTVNSAVHLAHKGVDTDHSKERSKRPESRDENTPSHLSDTFALKGGQKEEHHRASSLYPDVLFIQGDWSQHSSLTMSLPCKGKNLPSVKRGDGETDAGMYGDIMRPGNGIWHSPYPKMKPRRWEKLPMSECTEKGVTLTVVISDKLRTENVS